MKVMIKCLDDDSVEAAPREKTQFQGRFGIQGNALHRFIGIGFLVDLVNLIEDGVGLCYLFQRETFFTRFSP